MLKHDLKVRIPVEGLTVLDPERGPVPYRAHPDLVAAAQVALALRRPLLLTGEPGCGKTDFASAVARALGLTLHTCPVRSDSRAADLLYHYDALRRFGDAHHGGDEAKARAAEVHPYVHLNGLGRALTEPGLSVVLIDEIDKAQRDLPNDLLRELDAGTFEILEIPADAPRVDGKARTMGRADRADMPLVIITSNHERQLPDAFLRRVVYYHIDFPDDPELRKIVHDRHGSVPWIDQALTIFGAVRRLSVRESRPSTSELLDWVGSLRAVFDEGHVRGVLTEVAVAVAAGRTEAIRRAPAWGCLVKSRDDLRAARMDVGAPRPA